MIPLEPLATCPPPAHQDWQWQQRNMLQSAEDLLMAFPGLRDTPQLSTIIQHLGTRKLGITPYLAGLIDTDAEGCPLPDDPLWRQVAPLWPVHARAQRFPGSDFAYDGAAENWELPGEMVTPICQHKYANRVLVRTANICHAYCQFCYEALRTLERRSHKQALKKSEWQLTLDYLTAHPEVEEVILSGGEPLMLSDRRLNDLLQSLREHRPDIIIRLHTRALTFNPYRITDELLAVLHNWRVTAVGVHISHSREISLAFIEAATRLHGAVPVLFANMPLLAGINDNYTQLKTLCMRLYGLGIVPHYLYQFMPFSPGAEHFCTPLSRGVALVSQMKRRLSNLAVPEFVLPHRQGKYSVPLDLEKAPPCLHQDAFGNESMYFTNWQGAQCVFPE
jgi:lysine 2,3-aminomutase